jgi:ABC-type nickel/cobalt efflux system permease component RcnA
MALLVLAGTAGLASAHPLGNYTVNRALAVTVAPAQVAILYVLDMAEIPAFSEIAAVDLDGDGAVSAGESSEYASTRCELIGAAIRLQLDDTLQPLRAAREPELTFPDGAGGLRTLRLVCHLSANLAEPASRIAVTDPIDDGHVGWREVTISAAAGVRLNESTVPAASGSALLTAYPADLLQTPPDVRRAEARLTLDGTASGAVGATAGASLVAPTAGDPLSALLEGELSPPIVLLGLVVAAGLGAAHALSPGHGKALVAAYLIGSRGTARQAMALGLTVAATHTAGVLVLGALVLIAGELFLPELVIGWLTIVSGGLMAVLGAGLLWRALAGRHTSGHPHPHPHPHGRGRATHHVHQPAAAPPLSVRSVALLGIAGGLVPSASALIVLLAAVTTGRLVFGLGLIIAFGAGMAAVLGGLAVAATVARRWFSGTVPTSNRYVQTVVGGLPIGSGVLVLGIGIGVAISAVSRLG